MKDKKYIWRKIKKFKNDYKKYKYIKGILKGIILSLILIIVYIFLVLSKILIYREVYLMYIFIGPLIIFLIFSFLERKADREIIKKADQRLGLEQRLITYYDYHKEGNKNPFFSALEKELATLLKKIPSQPIFKLKWKKYIKIIAVLFGTIIFLNSYFTINRNLNLNLDSSNDIFQEESSNEDSSEMGKIEFINPIESKLNSDSGEEISTINNNDINRIEDKKVNNDLEEEFEKPKMEKNQEGDLAELEKRLEKIEEEKNQKDSNINMEGKKDEQNQEQNSSYLWKNQNKEGLVDNEDNIYKPGEEDSTNKDKGTEGPGGKGSDETEGGGEEYQAIGDN